MRDRLRRLEASTRGEMIEVPQHDGTVERFPQSACAEALVTLLDGREHPLAIAARNSPDPEWQRSFYASEPLDPGTEDLSE